MGIKLSSSSVQAGQSMMYSTSLCLSGRNISSCYCFITFNFADIRNLVEGNVRWVVQICCAPSWEWKDPPVKGIKVKEEVAHTQAQRTALEIDPRAHPPQDVKRKWEVCMTAGMIATYRFLNITPDMVCHSSPRLVIGLSTGAGKKRRQFRLSGHGGDT